MQTPRGWAKVLRIVAIALGVLVLSFAVFVQIQQRLLRWRAERLLADIRAIQMGKSTVADAERLMHKWGAWGEWQGDCEKNWCVFRVWIDDASHGLHRFPVLNGGNWGPQLRWPRWMNRPYAWMGGRLAEVEGEFVVQHGVVWSKSFGVLVTPFPEEYGSNGELIADTAASVIGQAQSGTSCFHGGPFSLGYFSTDDPEICLWADDMRGHWAIAQFTPFADEKTIRNLMNFNLDCISSWKPCRTSNELMPTAVSLLEESRKKTSRSGGQIEHLPLWILARDLEYVAMGEALAIPRGTPYTTFRPFRVMKLLKGSHRISGAGIYMVDTVDSDETCSISSAGTRTFDVGAKVLMMFNEPLNRDPAKGPDFVPCIAVPMNEQNLAEVQRGIARDMILRDSAVY